MLRHTARLLFLDFLGDVVQLTSLVQDPVLNRSQDAFQAGQNGEGQDHAAVLATFEVPAQQLGDPPEKLGVGTNVL